MKVLLVCVPLDFPLAVYSLASNLVSLAGIPKEDVRVLRLRADCLTDYNQKAPEVWRYIARVQQWQPDIIGYSVYLWNAIAIGELTAITRRLFPHIKLVVGGPEIANEEMARLWVGAHDADIAVRGEGEVTFADLVRALEVTGSPRGIAGCTWRDGSSVVHEAPRPPLHDLGILSSPYLTGIVSAEFANGGTSDPIVRAFPRMLIETYRGCYMQCPYCQRGAGAQLRFRFPMDRVLGELDWVLRRRVASIWIIDAMFGYKLADAKQILRFIAEAKDRHGASTRVLCYHNPDYFDEELFDLYAKANVGVELDLQTTSPKVLQTLGRGRWGLGCFEKHLAAFEKFGVPSDRVADLILGFPGDNLEQFKQSLDDVISRGYNINVYHLSMLPGVSMERSASADGVTFSSIPPRDCFANNTFALSDVIRGRLLGHGVDLFRRAPKTAHALTKLLFGGRPSSLCEAFGQALWERYELMWGDKHSDYHTYDSVIQGMDEKLKEVLAGLAASAPWRDALLQLLDLELAMSACAQSSEELLPITSPWGGALPEVGWLNCRLRFDERKTVAMRLEYPIQKLLGRWQPDSEVPGEDAWRSLVRGEYVGLLYRPRLKTIEMRVVDSLFTYELMKRLNGYFSLSETLSAMLGEWQEKDVAPLRMFFNQALALGFIQTGPPDGQVYGGAMMRA